MTRRPRTSPSAVALLGVLAALGLAACGSDGPSASPSSAIGSTAGTVAAATVPAAGSGATGSSAPGDAAASSETAVTTAGSGVAPAASPSAVDPSATSSASSSASSSVSSSVSSSATTGPSWAEGFSRATVTMDGRPLRVLVASTEAQRHEGLRQVSSLAPFDGMLFVFDQEGRVAFTMADTLIPLSIGFYDSTGQSVGQLDMVPCVGTDSTCRTYDVGHPFRYALETAQGQLPAGPIQI